MTSTLRISLCALALLFLDPQLACGSQGGADPSAYKGWAVSSLHIHGLDKALATQLKKGLALSGERKLLRRTRPIFYPHTLQEDVDRSRLFLARRGYPYAVVETRFEPDSGKRRVSVIFEVEPGPPVLVQSVSVVGLPPQQELRSDAQTSLRPGARLSEDEMERTAGLLESLLKHAGYAHAVVEARVEREDSTGVAVEFQAQPGALYRFGQAGVEGVSVDLVPLVLKTIDLEAGVLYSPAIVQEAEDYLRLLGQFSRIRLSTHEAGPETLDLRADLLERRPRTLETNIGYWTDDLVRVGARWHHRNLFRAGRGLEIKGSSSRFLQDASVSVNWPGFFGTRTWGLASVGVESQREEGYNLVSTELELAGTYRPSLLSSFRVGVAVSNVDVERKTEEAGAFVEQGGLLTAFSAGWSRDSSNDRLFPTGGIVSWIRVEWAPPGFLSESHYISLETSGTVYKGLWRGAVAAGRIGASVAEPIADSIDLLPNKRFYSGGATSMRGFKRRKLGPLDDEGAPLGGEARLEAALELRFPVVWRLVGAVFVDTGQVWLRNDQISLDELEAAVGPGLMIRTPVGPVRADWGYRVTDREPTQPRSVFHISIGHPF